MPLAPTLLLLTMQLFLDFPVFSPQSGPLKNVIYLEPVVIWPTFFVPSTVA